MFRVDGTGWNLMWAALLLLGVLGGYHGLGAGGDREARFSASHRTVAARLADTPVWAVRHLVNLRPLLVGSALATLVVTTVGAVGSVLPPEKPQFDMQEAALAIGALTWGAMLEYVDLRERNGGDFNVNKFRAAHIFLVVDLVLVAVTKWGDFTPATHGTAFLTGAALVASADIISLLLGVLATGIGINPLEDPATPPP